MNGLMWFKSSYSSANGQCVECALLPGGGMAVRDTEDRAGAVLAFGAAEWRLFAAAIKDADKA
jgi:hypothetical protein